MSSTPTAREMLLIMARFAFENTHMDQEFIKNKMNIKRNKKNERNYYRVMGILKSSDQDKLDGW